MEQLLLVNPRGRRKRRTPSRDSKGRFLKRGKSSASKRRRRENPVPFSLNPKRRKRRSASAKHRNWGTVKRHQRRVNPSHRRRRNPTGGGFLGNLTRPLMPAVVGAGGAFATDAAFAYLPLPMQLKTGNLAIVSKAVLAVALGMVVSRFMNRRIGEQMTAGALTVQAHQALSPFVAGVLPGALGYYGAGYALPANGGVGEYISDIPNSMRDSNFYARDPLGEYISD